MLSTKPYISSRELPALLRLTPGPSSLLASVGLENLPSNILKHIVQQVVVVVEGHRSGLRILPLVSRTLLRCLQDLSLAVGQPAKKKDAWP